MNDADRRERRMRLAYAALAWCLVILSAAGALAILWVIVFVFLGFGR